MTKRNKLIESKWNPAAARIISFEIFFVKFILSYSKFVKVQKKKTKKLVTRLHDRHSMINATWDHKE